MERHVFFERKQTSNEKNVDYAAELMRLSARCEFGVLQESLLRDRFISGLRDRALQKRLFTEIDLSWEKAQAIAASVEFASKNVDLLHSSDPPVVHAVSTLRVPRHIRNAKNKAAKKVHCHRCNGGHLAKDCTVTGLHCTYCDIAGHNYNACLKRRENASSTVRKKPQHTRSTHAVVSEDSSSHIPSAISFLHHLTDDSKELPASLLDVLVDGVMIRFEIDNGSAKTVLSEKDFRNFWPDRSLKSDSTALRTWSQDSIQVKGMTIVDVAFANSHFQLPLLVTANGGRPLLGRNWFSALGIQVQIPALLQAFSLQQSATSNDIQPLLEVYKDVFISSMGKYSGPPVHVHLQPEARPKYCRARPVAHALRSAVEEELLRLQQAGIITSVNHSDWATPIVPVQKSDGSLRICGDYSATVNPVICQDRHPLPTLRELFDKLSGATIFTHLDMAKAYLQLELDDESQHLLTLNTHLGLFKVHRLQFGIASAPAIFQRVMDGLLGNIPGVIIYQDDLLISAPDPETHWQRLSIVLRRLNDNGFRLNKKKCIFSAQSIVFLGHHISAQGISPLATKVEAIQQVAAPTNKVELQSFLGLINFYSSFIPDRATLFEPLHRLLDNNSSWSWTPTHEHAFQKAKDCLCSSITLMHYDPNLPLSLSCDASPYGVGAVLSHILPSGQERPVAYASRTLTQTQRNYSQLDKEALAIIFAVTHFHQYVYGRQVTIYTDHRPLLGILGRQKATPLVMSPRLLRWKLTLSAFNYDLQYRPGKKNANADFFSRFPVATVLDVPAEPAEICALNSSQLFSLTAIQSSTAEDSILSRVFLWVQHGWPANIPSTDYNPYFARRAELTSHCGTLLWGNRVVIPSSLKQDTLELLHAEHPGVIRMKALARSYVWWPKIDHDIEHHVKCCEDCQLVANQPSSKTATWPSTERPWQRIHLDFFGPFKEKYFLIAVDAHSNWIEVRLMPNITALTTIAQLRYLFATFGLPETVVSDNGPSFVSEEFKKFVHDNNIDHVLTPPYHPASNGQAERAVQTTKQALKKYKGNDWHYALANFMLQQHVIPHATTQVSPAETFLKRRLRTVLSAAHPLFATSPSATTDSSLPRFQAGDAVYVRSQNGPFKWRVGTVIRVMGQNTFLVKLPDGREFLQHHDQIRRRLNSSTPPVQPNLDDDLVFAPSGTFSSSPVAPIALTPSAPRRSTRNRRAPERLGVVPY